MGYINLSDYLKRDTLSQGLKDALTKIESKANGKGSALISEYKDGIKCILTEKPVTIGGARPTTSSRNESDFQKIVSFDMDLYGNILSKTDSLVDARYFPDIDNSKETIKSR